MPTEMNPFCDKSKISTLEKDLLRTIYKHYYNTIERTDGFFIFPEGDLHVDEVQYY